MEIRRALLTLLIVWNTIASQPITDENTRHSRQSSMDCCPCPTINEKDLLSDQDTSPTNPFVSSMVDNCPCRGKDTDSIPDSSFLSPALQALRPLIKAERKPDPNPLLKPEVSLASSVLETLREVTDEEYRDALTRDAARNAIQSDLHLLESPIDPRSGIINIILNPEDANSDLDVLPEESHVQETRCIHSPLSGVNLLENDEPKPFSILQKQKLKFPNINNLHTNIFEMENSASNLKEQIDKPASFIPFRKFTTLQTPNLFPISYGEDYAKESNKATYESLSKSKISDLKLATIINNLKKSRLSRPTGIEMSEEHTKFKNNQEGALNRPTVSDKNNNLLPLQNSNVINNMKTNLFRNSAMKIRNLLKLKDVELIPPTRNKKLINLGIDKKNDNQKDGILSNNNDVYIDKTRPVKKSDSATEFLDILSSPSNDNIKKTLLPQTPNEPLHTETASLIKNHYNSVFKNKDPEIRDDKPLLNENVPVNYIKKDILSQSDMTSGTDIKQPKVIDANKNGQTNSEDLLFDASYSGPVIAKEENENAQSTTNNIFSDDTYDTTEIIKPNNKNALNSIRTDILQIFDNLQKSNDQIQKNTKSNVHNFLQLVNKDKITASQNNNSWISADYNKIIHKEDVDDIKQTTLKDCTVSDRSLSIQDLQNMSDSVLNSSLIKQNITRLNISHSREISSKKAINTDENNSNTNTSRQYNKSLSKNYFTSGPLKDNNENLFETNTTLDDSNEKIFAETTENGNIKNINIWKSDNSSTGSEREMYNETLNSLPALEPMTKSIEHEMNAEASEPVFNRLLPKNSLRSSITEEINTESNFIDNNSYRYLIEKRLQEISHLLKLNQAACDNDFITSYDKSKDNVKNNNLYNQFQSESSNIVPTLQTGGESQLHKPLPIRINDLPRFHAYDNLENTNLNSYQTRINAPEVLDRRYLKSAYDGGENTLSVNKLQNYFANKNIEKEFPKNRNDNILQKSYSERNTNAKNAVNQKLKAFSLPINEFSDAVKLQTEESFRNIQDAIKSTLKSTKPQSEILEKAPISTNLLKDLSTKHSNIDNKLQSWHMDLTDKLHSFSRNVNKPSKPLYNNLLGSHSNNIPFRRNKDILKECHGTPVLRSKNLQNLPYSPVKPLIKKQQYKEFPAFLKKINNNQKDIKQSLKDIADKGISNVFQDPTKRLHGYNNILRSDKKIRLPENDRFRNSFTTIRPSPIESLKKTLERPFQSQGTALQSRVHSKPPHLLRNSYSRNEPKFKSNEPNPLASEIIPTRAKVTDNIIPKIPTLQKFRKTPTFSSAEIQQTTKPNTNNEVSSQQKTVQAPKLPFKLKTERVPALSKILDIAKSKPSNTLSLGGNKNDRKTNNSIEAASENVKSVSPKEETLKENIPYKCKMICYKDVIGN